MRASPSAAACRSYAACWKPRGSTTRSGSRFRRARRRRRRCSARSTRARSSSSRGAATAWCSAASTSSRGRAWRLAIVPAGTANLFASNLGIPQDIEEAVAIGLRGDRREIDVGRFNGERFAVMAGAGFDAAMIRDAGDGGLKDRFGRAAYVWTGSENLRLKPFRREDRSRRSGVVQGQGNLHPARERRQALRRPRGVRGRARRRREARGRSRDRRRRARLVANDHARSCRVGHDNLRSHRRPRRATSRSSSRGRSSTSSTVATGRR